MGWVQLGSALSVHLILAVGPARTAWLRLSMGALIFLAFGAYAAKTFPPGPSYGPIRHHPSHLPDSPHAELGNIRASVPGRMPFISHSDSAGSRTAAKLNHGQSLFVMAMAASSPLPAGSSSWPSAERSRRASV